MSKYTPGPWQCDLQGYGAFTIEKDAHDFGSYVVIADRGSHETRVDEMHANARLIAAAPELLEALQDLLDLAVGHDLPCSDPERLAAREAIAKALGTE